MLRISIIFILTYSFCRKKENYPFSQKEKKKRILRKTKRIERNTNTSNSNILSADSPT